MVDTGWREYEAALAFAVAAHAGQRDKADQPLINHPIRVAASFRDPLLATIAVLHDVIEDTPTTLDSIGVRWGREVASVVDTLSRREGEPYAAYIERVATDPLAIEVKRADIADNLARIDEIPDRDTRMTLRDRYIAALDRMGWA